MYGWKIYAYKRKVSKAEEMIMKNKLKTRFDSGDMCFFANTHKNVISYGPDRQEVNIAFQENKYAAEDGNVETYHVVFWSIPLGGKTSHERAHQELYHKVMRRIPWEKQGFWLGEHGSLIPIPRRTMLRMKRR